MICCRCGNQTIGDNFICDTCKHGDDIVEDDEIEFIPCSKCDGHQACEDFGCAIELGLGRMVKKDIPHGSEDWG